MVAAPIVVANYETRTIICGCCNYCICAIILIVLQVIALGSYANGASEIVKMMDGPEIPDELDAIEAGELDDLEIPEPVEPDCDPYYDWDCDFDYDYDYGYNNDDYETLDDLAGLDDSDYKYHSKEDLDDMGGFMVAICILNTILLGVGLGLYVPYLMLPEPR